MMGDMKKYHVVLTGASQLFRPQKRSLLVRPLEAEIASRLDSCLVCNYFLRTAVSRRFRPDQKTGERKGLLLKKKIRRMAETPASIHS